jgi:hypothetical protein
MINVWAMNERIQNPHPFDMSSYYTGHICVLGGVDRRDKKQVSTPSTKASEDSYKLDWSFLKKTSDNKRTRPS